jgi:hypothetical protein
MKYLKNKNKNLFVNDFAKLWFELFRSTCSSMNQHNQLYLMLSNSIIGNFTKLTLLTIQYPWNHFFICTVLVFLPNLITAYSLGSVHL